MSKCVERDMLGREQKVRTKQMKPPGPDEGWAWVVAAACFMINFIMAGLARSAGVLYVALIEMYGASREDATMPFSIRVCVRNMTGPLVGMLGQRYGIRGVTISGGILAGVGGILCFVAPDIFWITIFWGVIHGFGFGLSTVLHMVTVNQYFDKYKATALGFSYSGDCIGTFILPIILEALLNAYGVRGTFLIIGAIVLNVVPLSMLLRPPPWLVTRRANKNNKSATYKDLGNETIKTHSYDNKGFIIVDESKQNVPVNNQISTGNLKYIIDEISSYNQVSKISEYEDSNDHEKTMNESNEPSRKTELELKYSNDHKNQHPVSELSTADENGRCLRTSSVCIDGYLPSPDMLHCSSKSTKAEECSRSKRSENVTEIIVENINQINSMTATITGHAGSGKETVIRIRASSETVRNNKSTDRIKAEEIGRSLSLNKHKNEINCSKSVDSEFTHNLTSEPSAEVSKEIEISSVECSNQNIVNPCIKISYDKNSDVDRTTVTPKILIEDVRETKQKEADFGSEDQRLRKASVRENQNDIKYVLKTAAKANIKPMFILISLTMAAYVLLFISVMTVIIDFGQDRGISRDAGKYLVISFSAADLVGRLGFGVVIDRRWIPMQHYAAMCVGLMGLAVALIPFGSGLLMLSTSMALYGFIQGGVAIMYPILIGKYMEKDEEAIGMGCLNFYGGVLMLAVAPMIGYFRDTYGSYDGMFWIVGLVTLVTGLAWFFEPIIFGVQKKQFDRTEVKVNVICEKEEIKT